MELIPIEYKIKHDFNEYTYYIVSRNTNKGNQKWFITMYRKEIYFNIEDMSWTYFALDWCGFNKPEEALEAFEKYLKN